MKLGLGKATTMVSLAAVFAAGLAAADGIPPGRTFYQIVVTSPGDRGQGWNGTLFQQSGAALPMQPGQPVQTNAGTFVPVPCGAPHDPCGFIEQRMTATLTNENLGPTQLTYRLLVGAECSRSEKLFGEILRDGKPVLGKAKDTLATPMGQFEWRESYSEQGWFHKLWPQHMMSPDNWPCKRP
jgi:hypothetical protein